MKPHRHIVAQIALAACAVAPLAAQSAARTPLDSAAADSVAATVVLQTSALGELLGDSLAMRIALAPEDTAVHRAAAALLVRSAEVRRSAGDHDGAARRLMLAAGLDASDAAIAHLRAAAASFAVAGDRSAQARALTVLASRTGQPDPALEALRLPADSVAPAERLMALLTVEHQARTVEGAVADSMLVYVCQLGCASVTDDAPALLDALRAELARGKSYWRGPVARAIVGLLAVDVLAARRDELMAMQWYGRADVEAAADSAVAAGRRQDAAALHYAHAYTMMPRRQVPVGGGRESLEAVRRAAALLDPADGVMRARTTSLLSLAYLRGRQLDSARAAHAAAERAAASADASLRATVRRRGATIAAAAGDTALALRMLDEAIALRQAAAIAAASDRLLVARELASAGAGAPALRLARLARPVLDTAGAALAAEAAMVLGESHRALSDGDSARAHFVRAAALRSRVGSHEDAAHLLAAAAEDLLERGRLAGADSMLDRAAAELRRAPTVVGEARQRFLNDRGAVLFGRGRFLEARALFRAARGTEHGRAEETEAVRNLALVDLALARDSVAAAAFHLGWTRLAGQYTTTAIEPPRAQSRPMTDAWAATYNAQAALARGDLATAMTSAREAERLTGRSEHLESRARASALLGRIFAQVGRGDSAAVYAARAGDVPAVAFTGAQREAAAGTIASAERLDATRTLRPAAALAELQSLLARGRAAGDSISLGWTYAELARHHFRRAVPQRLDVATAYYDSAWTVLRERNLDGLTDWYRIQFAERSARAQEEAALAWLARAGELGARRSAMGALAAADLVRGHAFNQLTGAGFSGRTLVDRVFRGAFLEKGLTEAGEYLLDEAGSYALTPWVLAYVHVQDTLVTWLRVPHAYGSGEIGTKDLLVTRRAITADSVAALVTRARAAIGADGAATRGIDVERIEPASGETMRGLGIRPGRDASAAEALGALADLLIPPALAVQDTGTIPLLVVAPGALASVPFAALPLPRDTVPMSARYDIGYSPSLLLRAASNSEATPLPRSGYASALDGRWTEPDSMRAVRRQWLSRAVVLGNPVMPAVPTEEGARIVLTRLPGAEAEAEGVARALGVQPLLGADASLAALRAASGSATIVHLATHGYAYGTEAKVDDSFVALAPTPADDGLLTVRELVEGRALTLSAADLVVLSACQTGLGQLTASEGTLGLQRAFLAAGASSVLVSLWSVSDEATAELLGSFYRFWLDDEAGRSKTEALRLAQESLRAKPAYAHPRYWAAFQLVGR